jgi:hypothetical protein
MFISSHTNAATINAATSSLSDVTAAINNASAGDTVVVPAGSYSWSSNIMLSKNITVKGAGAGNTIITGGAFNIDNSSARVSGFTFNDVTFQVVGGSHGFRIDHNTVTLSSWGEWLLAYGVGTNRPRGLIDNNSLTNGRVTFYGEAYGEPNGGGRYSWADPVGLGGDDAIYIEDNILRLPSGSDYGNVVDGNTGCRFVIRFNQVAGGRLEVHSLQGENQRGCMKVEIYDNTFSHDVTPNYSPMLIRAGSALIFHNVIPTGFAVTSDIELDNLRTWAQGAGAWGWCDGSSWVDGNAAGGEGYLCRDQLGAGQDASLWDYTQPAPIQARSPVYVWRNVRTNLTTEVPINFRCGSYCSRWTTKQFVANRDYFTYKAPFDGTSGVGEGPLANRPTTCMPGVAYWATDVGEWNAKRSGNDGQLYKCAATNTWALYYTPYLYPHPLQSVL